MSEPPQVTCHFDPSSGARQKPDCVTVKTLPAPNDRGPGQIIVFVSLRTSVTLPPLAGMVRSADQNPTSGSPPVSKQSRPPESSTGPVPATSEVRCSVSNPT